MDFITRAHEAIPGDVRMFSGCKDEQTSADVYDVSSFGLPAECGPGGAGGACTNAMIANLTEKDDFTWIGLLQGMRKTLQEKKYTQIPQLSSSSKMDLEGPFELRQKGGSGKTRSVLVGINYVGQQGELRGCHNDVITMQRLIEKHGFTSETQRVLLDDGSHEQPTRENIMKAMDWLVEGAEAGDSLFFHYSGHGGSMKDDSGDEEDNRDETLVPVDYKSAGQIRDDLILEHMVKPLVEGVQLTCVMDCCHSGSIMDLPYMFRLGDTAAAAIEETGAAPEMNENPGFSHEKLMKIGMKIYQMHQAGAGVAEIAQAAVAEAGGAKGCLGFLSGLCGGKKKEEASGDAI